MKIISWNVNGIRAVEKKDFTTWLATTSPDMLCVQETKAHPDQISAGLKAPVRQDGACYKTYWASAQKKGYSGVAIFSKVEPLDVKPLGVREFDNEGRFLAAFYEELVLISAYFPNSQEAGARLSYKLDFCAAILEYCTNLVQKGRHIVLCGDYNIAHNAIDLARPKANENNAGFLPEERAWMDKWTTSGFTDTFRHFHPGVAGCYTWWSYRFGAREKNIGWRLDYHCVDNAFLPSVKSSAILPDVQGSDHCPVELVLNI
ncbi:exodeoxyribonuclease III [Spirochaetia bacterium]|nr:exodeoxyribonuclease III [Spirochaetia bacterium]